MPTMNIRHIDHLIARQTAKFTALWGTAAHVNRLRHIKTPSTNHGQAWTVNASFHAGEYFNRKWRRARDPSGRDGCFDADMVADIFDSRGVLWVRLPDGG